MLNPVSPIKNEVVFEDVKVVIPDLTVHIRNQETHFTLKELRLLMVFLADPYRQIPSDELVERVGLTGRVALTTLVNSVRTLLDQRYIVCVYGFGYAFAEVRQPLPWKRQAPRAEVTHASR